MRQCFYIEQNTEYKNNMKFVKTEIVPGELLPEKCDPLNPLCNKMKWPKNNSRKT